MRGLHRWGRNRSELILQKTNLFAVQDKLTLGRRPGMDERQDVIGQSTPYWQGLGHQDQLEEGLETLLEMRQGRADSPSADLQSGKSN